MGTLLYDSFKSNQGSTYVYDGITATVIPDNGEIESIIKCRKDNREYEQIQEELEKQFPKETLHSSIQFMQRWEKNLNGFFLQEDITDTYDITEESIKNELDNGLLYLLVLSVTEECNFRCKYCYLSEEYKYTRNRTDRQMSFETAKSALDYYFSELKKYKSFIPNKRGNISFFGGEPLLAFQLMKDTVQYCKENSPVPVGFNITTNGYHMDEEVMDFLVDNEFNIAISLDGERVSNSNRVMANNHETFDRVYENIKRFREKYPMYNRIGILSVFDINTDFINNDKFFANSVLPPVLRVTGVAPTNTCYYNRFSEEEYKKYYEELDQLRKKYIECKINSKPMSSYTRMLFDTELMQFTARRRHRDRSMIYTGACIPGTKIGVRVDGTFDICERMNEKFPIGSVDEGLNYKNIESIMNEYKETITNACKTCIANKVCQLCYSHVACDGEFEMMKEYCNNTKNFLHNACSIVYSILEENPEACSDEEIEKIARNSIIFEN